MTPASLLASAKALIDGDPESAGLIDLCDVVRVSTATDDYGGATSTETTLASDVPCLYEDRTHKPFQAAGMASGAMTHDLFLLSTAVTKNIQPHYKIVVAARDDTPELTFEDPIRLDESLSPLVHLGVNLRA